MHFPIHTDIKMQVHWCKWWPSYCPLCQTLFSPPQFALLWFTVWATVLFGRGCRQISEYLLANMWAIGHPSAWACSLIREQRACQDHSGSVLFPANLLSCPVCSQGRFSVGWLTQQWPNLLLLLMLPWLSSDDSTFSNILRQMGQCSQIGGRNNERKLITLYPTTPPRYSPWLCKLQRKHINFLLGILP